MKSREEGEILGYDIRDPKQKEELVRFLAQEYASGKSVQEALEVDQQLLDNVYAVAYRKYQSGDYKSAADLFRYLLMFDDREYKYLLGMAASLHKQGEFGSAAALYMVAAVYNPKDPVAYFHAADCFIHTSELERALASVAIAAELAKGDEKYKELEERALLIKKHLSEKIEDNK